MKSLIDKITEAELEVLRVLWETEEDLPVAAVIEQLQLSTDWEDSTIKTLLRRLCRKGVVEVHKRDVFHYRPLVGAKQYNEHITRSLIERLYEGSAKNLVASLIGNKQLDDADIKELRNKCGKTEI